MKILLIEDDRHQAEIMTYRLKSRHELYIATSLNAGIEEFEQLKPEVVMVDLALPDSLNYKDTIKRISAVRAEAALIVITGWDATKELIDECIRFSTDGFIVKGRGDQTPALLDAELEKAVRNKNRR